MFKNVGLKKYSIWSTWDNTNILGKPFDFCNTKDANEIRANMGLDKNLISKQILLFIFSLPPSIEPKIPTIADAGLSQYFEPNPNPNENHGWTVNWHLEPKLSKYNLGAKPECIHQAIELNCVNLPIDIRC